MGTHEVVSVFGREILNLRQPLRKYSVADAHRYWRSLGFPYVCLSQDEMDRLFRILVEVPPLKLNDGDTLGSSTVGLRLANAFHPQMWQARSHGHLRSPFDYFNDDVHLWAMLERAPRFWPNRRCWAPQAIRNLARVYSGGRVANFRPTAARSIINQFSSAGDAVLDFSAGYGGRLLACLTLDRQYTGIDPARRQVAGLKRMCKALAHQSRATAAIVEGCAEDVIPTMDRASVDLVFSSPPFFNLEIYSNEASQSSCRYKTYDEWRAHFLATVIAHSARVLRRSGYFAINVSSSRRCPLERDTIELASRHFAYRCQINIVMHARPLQRATNGSAFRTEPIYVFQKR